MDLSIVLDWAVNQWPAVKNLLAALGGLLVLASAWIKFTPWQSDDEWYIKMESKPVIGWILKALPRFSIVERKPPAA